MIKLSKDKRDKLIMVVLATIGAIGLLYTFVIGAQKDKLAEYATKISKLQDDVDKAERWGKMSRRIQTELQKSREELQAKEEGMAPVDKYKWFFNLISPFADARGVRLTSISADPKPEDVLLLPKFPYQAVSFSVKAAAQYHDLGKFLADFENEFVYMRVQDLKIEREGGAGLATAPGPASAQRPGGSRGPAPSTTAAAAEQLSVDIKIVTLVKPITSL
ncbi:MAG: hypothetical protein HY674_22805 [Chloroflexi bacterium]|nr:hypothetical protein [Chloroflexota bacterium]